MAQSRIGALDGMRAIAVTAVVVYHLWPSALPSGFLGVDVFMVVSGFIVTNLLMRERDSTGRIRLGAFWGRRFRRLVPALMLLIVVVTCWVHVTGPATLIPAVRSQGLSALFYVTNWKLISTGVTYGGMLAANSPFVHLWSLAVEEQFYLLWPLLLVGVLAVARGRRGVVIAFTTVATLASAAWMAWLYVPGGDPSRVYYGTDTRAQAFLAGAVAALVAPLLGRALRRAVSVLGAFALVAVVVAMRTNAPNVLYRGGFLLVAVGTACAALATTMRGPVQRALDHGPLRGLGRVSYGVYLWHWPAIVLLTPARIGVDGVALTALRLGVTAAGTSVSWLALERPIARARAPRVALSGAVAIAAALAALLVLPPGQQFAYANVRTDHIPKPVLLAPPSTSATQSTAAAEAAPVSTPGPLTTVPVRAGRLALPASGTAMLVGDSGMFSGTPAFAAGLQAAGWGVVETAFPGIGLTSRGQNFRAQWAADARQDHVDLTIAMLGGWDAVWLQQHGVAAYTKVVESTVAAFTAGGGKVLWLSELPGSSVPERGTLDAIFASMARRYPGTVAYLDIQSSLRGPGGGWPRVVNGLVLRQPDGWHLCQDGSVFVARMTLEDLGLYRPGWEEGAWRTDPRYLTNSCPR